MDSMGIESTNTPINKASAIPSLPSIISSSHQEQIPILSPEKCGDKMKTILKEYFIGGDKANAVLSVHEMVIVGTDGSLDRGSQAVATGILMVMEMKEGEVQKFLTVMESCMNESKIERQAIVQGLNEPLELLSDIEIDAPIAGSLLALIISQFLKWNIMDFDFLLSAPEAFLTDGNPSVFGRKVLEKRGGVPTDVELGVLDKLDKKETNEEE
jgi:hypothetical protein